MPWVLHVDLDQFIAAVEVLRRPELAGRPVIVGGSGDPTQRAVVATASYEAREFGVHSGMPLRHAARKCPDAVLLATDGPAYDEASAEVMTVLRGLDEGGLDVVVEQVGWDEAFLGAETDDPENLAARIRQEVFDSTRLRCSVGIGDNKLRAKLATGFAKPDGVFRLTADNWYEMMGDRPTDVLWGIGRKTARKLAELNLHTVRELAAADSGRLAEVLGPTMGPWYAGLGRGEGSKAVSGEPYRARSRSRETTFQTDLIDPTEIRAQAAILARRVFDDVVADGRAVARVAAKVRYAPFFTHTRSLTLPVPSRELDAVEQAVDILLDLFESGRAVRLLGVRAEFVRD